MDPFQCRSISSAGDVPGWEFYSLALAERHGAGPGGALPWSLTGCVPIDGPGRKAPSTALRSMRHAATERSAWFVCPG